MRKFELIVPCHFGMEAVLKREINDLGYEITVAYTHLTLLTSLRVVSVVRNGWRLEIFSNG